MKHFYETIGENWFSWADFYREIVGQLPNPAAVVEVGCWRGRSTACLGVEIINAQKDVVLYCVDTWAYYPETEQPALSQTDFDGVYREFTRNVRPFEHFLWIMRQPSIKAAAEFSPESVDFVFIDANHKYENVLADIRAWLPVVKPGGVIAGHDYYTRQHPGVARAVDEAIDGVILIPEQNVWMYYKDTW